MKLVLTNRPENAEYATRNWWLESTDTRGVVFANEADRRIFVNSFTSPERREQAMRNTFTAQGAFYGRDDLKELAVANVQRTLPVLFRRLGATGNLTLATGSQAAPQSGW